MKRLEKILVTIALFVLISSAGCVCLAKGASISSGESRSSNAAATKMIKTVGRKMVSALESV